ncbi:MAG: MG2 domain-containing protein [Saprospiraceae bacterium]
MRTSSLYFLLFIFTLISGCNKSQKDVTLLDPSRDQALLSKYFDAATVGVISSYDKLLYVLKTPVSSDVVVEDTELQKMITLDPVVSGKVTFTSQSVLSFIPDKPLASNTAFTVRINLKKLLGEHFEPIAYTVRTFQQDMMIQKKGVEIHEDMSKSVLLEMSVADKVDLEQIKSCIIADGGEIVVTPNGENTFDIAIKYPKTTTIKNIKYDGKPIGADAKGEIDLSTYDSTHFTQVSTYHDIKNKEMSIFFSNPIDAGQDAAGLITVNGTNASYQIKNNILKIFLSGYENAKVAKIKILPGLRSNQNITLDNPIDLDIELELEKPSLSLMFDGTYFPSSGEFKIPIKTRALKEVRIQVIEIKQQNVAHFLTWQNLSYQDYYSMRMFGIPIFDKNVPLNQGIKDKEGYIVHGIDLTQQVKRNPGSVYYISMDYLPSQTTLPCTSAFANQDFNSSIKDSDYFNYVNSEKNNYYYGEGYNWREIDDPCKPSFYMDKAPIRQLLICSDFNIFAKKAGNSYYFAVNTLDGVDPVGGATITGYNMRGDVIASEKTSDNGYVSFEKLHQDITVISLEKNGSLTYLAINDNTSNPLTEFDIESERYNFDTDVYIYTDRDVWRPGDSIYVYAMTNASQANIHPGIPIVMKFLNPDNQILDKQTKPLNFPDDKIYNFKLKTNPSAKTGNYRVVFEIGPKTITKKIQIETIKPNTTEAVFALQDQQGSTVYTNRLKGTVQVKLLTGFDVASAKLAISGRAASITKPFILFGDYNFGPTLDDMDAQTFEIFNGTTDNTGKAHFNSDFDLKFFHRPVNLNLETETTLPQGGSNKEGKNIKVFPFKTYVGTKRIDGSGWYGNYTFSEDAVIQLVSVTDKGSQNKKSTKYTWTLYQNIHSWWVDKYRLRSSGYFSNGDYWKEIQQGDGDFTSKGVLKFSKGKLVKGAYKVVVTDTESGHISDTYFTVYDGKESIPDKQPYIITIDTDKDSYKAGDGVVVKFPDLKSGKALISIERGNQIIEQVWHDLDINKELTLFSDLNWAPNAYIHVAIIQPYFQKNNDLPLRMYGIKYVQIDGESGRLKPEISVADKLESNKNYNVVVKETSGKDMEYTLAVVDEGLLNITGFQTPDPFKNFNGKFPLLVKTWDIYQYLIGYFKGKFAGIITIGGDNAYHPDAMPEINRYKPIAISMGPFKVEKNQSRTHTITIPNYIGKLRFMVVACNDKSFGSTEKLVQVKNPIMVQSQLPRSLYMTDKVELPVTVLKDDAKIIAADLSVKTDPNMVKVDKKFYNISLSGKDQNTQTIMAEILNTAGKTSLGFDAKGGNKSMTEKTEIVVNYPNSYETSISSMEIKPGETKVIPVKSKGYPEAYTSSLSVGGLKVPNFMQFSDELIDYPYGCLEQVSSSAFSQLYLDKVLALSPQQNRERLENLQAAINKISRLQRSDGKFNYWDNDYYNTWSDIYAGYFLVEARSQNVLNQADMLQRWMTEHLRIANEWSFSSASNDWTYDSESMVQAFRLYVLAKGGRPSKSAMNRFITSNKSLNPYVWWLMAGAYKFSGLESTSLDMIKKAESLNNPNSVQYYAYNFGSEDRNFAIILDIIAQSNVPMEKKTRYYDYFVNSLNASTWHSTQTMGYAFVAVYHYFGKNINVNTNVKYTIKGLGTNGNFDHKSTNLKVFSLQKPGNAESISIKNDGSTSIFVDLTERFISDKLDKPEASSQLKMTVNYKKSKSTSPSLIDIELGEDITILVTVTNPEALPLENLALNVKMPSGWELLNPRLYATRNVQNNFTYQDYRDDRVYTFFNLKAKGSETFVFKAKASYRGNFFLPSVTCEHMYKGNIYARMASDRVSIK